jgi:hypothetical protein
MISGTGSTTVRTGGFATALTGDCAAAGFALPPAPRRNAAAAMATPFMWYVRMTNLEGEQEWGRCRS